MFIRAVLFMLFFSLNSAAANTLTLSTWCSPPLSNKQQTGYFDQLIKHAFSMIGKNVVIEMKPAERSLQDANNGLTDGEFIRVSNISDLYPNLLIVPEPIYLMDFVAFHHNISTTKANNWQDLTHHSIGFVNGWKIIEKNTQFVENKISVSNQQTLFKLLEAGRFDFAIYSKVFGQQVIKNLSLSHIKYSNNKLAQEPMYLFLHKRHRALIPELTKALKELKTGPLYQVIHQFKASHQ